jgi:hypothetical protein
LKSFIFTSTSTKHWPPSTSWKLCQKLHMTIERVKSIYRFHRLVLNREDGNLKCFNRATKSYLLCILLFNVKWVLSQLLWWELEINRWVYDRHFF